MSSIWMSTETAGQGQEGVAEENLGACQSQEGTCQDRSPVEWEINIDALLGTRGLDSRCESCFTRLAGGCCLCDQRKCIHCPVYVSLQEAKKSRLPILIKPSRSLGNMYQLPVTQEVVAQLQGQVLELQGELKEFKIRNKQLHQKLILAEAMMEGRPAPDKTLQKGKHREKCRLRELDE